MKHTSEAFKGHRKWAVPIFLFILSAVATAEGSNTPEHSELPSREVIQTLPADGGSDYNRLIFETSPYLRQHASNPVDWYPWSEEAFNKARAEDKPIFLSVGYSSCHWCHVMEHESFKDAEVAEILNEHFISIKLDREERPDVDTIYMTVTQLMTGQGGWPNSVFMRADQKPFFAGTYFPKEDQNGRPGFKTLLRRIAASWHDKRDQVNQQSEQLAKALQRMESAARSQTSDSDLSKSDFQRSALSHFEQTHDAVNGGFGAAPKFPPHGALAYLLELQMVKSESAAEPLVTQTLDQMALGGIHDHVGGGFHRYSTDANWFLPHFEKMLYDNAQLLRVYAVAASTYDRNDYREVCLGIAQWMQREMRHPDGGYYSALSAVTEDVEGKTYLWSAEEVAAVLTDTAAEFSTFYQISESGNYYEEATGEFKGTNIPFLELPLPADRAAALGQSRELLLAARNKRAQPELDDKVLTSWNALAIGALATAGNLLEEPELISEAEHAARFVTSELFREGRLLRSFREGEARVMGYLDDYVFLADGLIDLHVATGSQQWLDQAIQLMQTVEGYFGSGDGVYYLTASDHEELLLRTSDPYDSALPSGIGMAALVYARLDTLLPDAGYAKYSRKIIETYSSAIKTSPQGSTSLLRAQLLLDAEDLDPYKITTETSYLEEGVVEVTLRIDIKSGWHINSDKPGNSMLIPTAVTLKGEGAVIKRLDYPKGTILESPSINESISIYEGVVTIPIVIEFDPSSADDTILEVTAQPCSDTLCLAPVTQQFTIKLSELNQAVE